MGLLVVLVVAKEPQRLPIAIPVVPFEVGAFIVAATGGVNIGINLFFGGDIVLAIREWLTLFYTLVIPLQFISAFFEGILAHRVYIMQRKPCQSGCQRINTSATYFIAKTLSDMLAMEVKWIKKLLFEKFSLVKMKQSGKLLKH